MTGPTVRVARYVVSCVPDDFRDAYQFDVAVEERWPSGWAVLWAGYCLGEDGEWDFEPLPSSRTDEWKATHRFSLEQALELAMREAPRVTALGMTAAEAYKRHLEREAGKQA